MRRFIFLILLFSVAGGVIFYAPGGLLAPLNINKNTTFIIKKGDSTVSIAHSLKEQKIIPHAVSFLCGVAFLKLKKQSLKHGEYLAEPKITLWKLMQKIAKGDVVVHHITIPEGLTVYEVSKKLEDISILAGTIEALPSEGTLLPETYDYYWGESRQQVLQRMEKAMETLKNKIWAMHQSNCTLKNWDEVLILASIVEKETGLPEERDLVASVYLNRLQINMPLQADPTVIYAVTKGQTSFYRPIFKSDLATDSPYNTYLNKGLPPTPIACPGEASIMAVLKPAQTAYLYFVASGTGGHEFSPDLKAHNQNVKSLRQIEKQKKRQL
ncbi:MAG: endolytic transglycosylase MltG [Alphaproteobacteria bacterium]